MTETRVKKAQRLVDEERITILWRNGRDAEGTVREKEGYYHTIVFNSGHFLCTCPWGTDHSFTDNLCAHALAIQLAMEKGERACLTGERSTTS